MLSPLFVLPFVTRAAGPEGWAAIATGQALGVTASLVVQFGWGTTGPPRVATLVGIRRRELYATSVLMRALILIAVLPPAVLATLQIVDPQWGTIASVLCAAAAFTGLGPGWFFVGIGRPMPLMWFETLPRLVGLIISTVVIAYTGNLMLYAIVTFLVEATMVAVSASVISHSTASFKYHGRQVAFHAREQWALALSALVSSGYTRLSVPIVTLFAYSQAPTFASADRIQTLSRSAIKPFVQSFQGWASEARHDRSQFLKRFKIATLAVTAVGLLVSTFVALLLPVFDEFLFGPDIPINHLQSVLIGVAIFGIGISNCTANFYLAPQNKIGAVARSTIVASVLGVPLIWIGAETHGAAGALGAIGIVEIGVATWQILAIARDSGRNR